MLRYNEISDEELIELSNNEIEELIDLECAHENIRLLPPEPENIEKKFVNPDVIVYEIPSIKLTSLEEAEKLVSMINQLETKSEIPWNSSYDHRQVKPDNETISFSSEKRYSPELYKQINQSIKIFQANKEEYDKKMEEYDKIKETRQIVIEKVIGAVTKARNKIEKIRNLRLEYDRYLKLTEGDRNIAWNFMIDARPNQQSELAELKMKIAIDVVLDA